MWHHGQEMASSFSPGMPFCLGPNAIFGLTVSHGNRAKSWNTMPRSGPARKPAKSGSAKPAVGARPAKAAAEKKPSKRAARAPARRKPEISAEQRRRRVELAAYFIAERHGFTPGREHEDWLAAEAEIDRLLEAGLLAP